MPQSSHFLPLEKRLYEPDEIIRNKKDDILLFIFLEEYKKSCRNAEVKADAYIKNAQECRISLLLLFLLSCLLCAELTNLVIQP